MNKSEMNLPVKVIGRVCKTNLTSWNFSTKKESQIMEEFPGVEIDIIYENLIPILVLVFESTEESLAFILKYGKEYV